MNEETPQNDEQRHRALLLHLAGPDVQDIFLTLSDTGAAWDYNKAVKTLNDHFVPQVNISAVRHAFCQMSQKEGETMFIFVTRLCIAARDCKYGDVDAQLRIRDEVIYKCRLDTTRRKLLDEGGDLNHLSMFWRLRHMKRKSRRRCQECRWHRWQDRWIACVHIQRRGRMWENSMKSLKKVICDSHKVKLHAYASNKQLKF